MATLEKIQEKLAALQAQADKLIAKKAQSALDIIRGLMIEHGLTTENIEAKAKEKRDALTAKHTGTSTAVKSIKARKNSKVKSAVVKSALPAKYFDPKTGKSWSGRGPTPAWLATTRSKNKFAVSEEAGTSAPSTAVTKLANKSASKSAAKSALPAKYHDPKTGKSWSGRGPAPAWLATPRAKAKYAVDSALSSAAPVAPAPAKKATRKTVKTRGPQAKKAQKVMYRDPETGKTWSGRGPAPAWLASAEDRSVYLVA